MRPMYLTVDGMFSGTGIRDTVNGGYLDPSSIGVSASLGDRISEWLERYGKAFFYQFDDTVEKELLDKQGIEIARSLNEELPDAKVTYFSDAELKEIKL